MTESRGDRIKRNFEQLESAVANIMRDTQEELSERRGVMVHQQERIETLEAQLHKAVTSTNKTDRIWRHPTCAVR